MFPGGGGGVVVAFGNVGGGGGGNFYLPQLEMGLLLAPSRHELGVLGNMLQSTGSTVKNYLAQNVSSGKGSKADLSSWNSWSILPPATSLVPI